MSLLLMLSLSVVGCESDRTQPIPKGKSLLQFKQSSLALGVLDADEWLEIPIIANEVAVGDISFAVEVDYATSSAIEGLHYTMESNALVLKKGAKSCAVRLKCNPDAFEINEVVELKLSLLLDEKYVNHQIMKPCVVKLQRCCPFEINNFVGYCKMTSSWAMQYMGVDALLVRTERDPDCETGIIVNDFYYEGYDLRLKLHAENRLEPIVEMADAVVIGSTGEAFGTIYGNGKLMMKTPEGYVSYYGTCENFLVLYGHIYVEEVGDVGAYVNILEWISDDEAERIMREGF